MHYIAVCFPGVDSIFLHGDMVVDAVLRGGHETGTEGTRGPSTILPLDCVACASNLHNNWVVHPVHSRCKVI